MDKLMKENENILKELANIDEEIETLNKHEEEIVQKRIFEEEINKLKGIINEKDEQMYDLVQRVKDIEIKNDTLEKSFSDEKTALENKKTENDNFYDDKFKALERKIYILEKRRLGSDFCEFFEKEFMSGSEKYRSEKEKHIKIHIHLNAMCVL
jgi:hypothetical protein